MDLEALCPPSDLVADLANLSTSVGGDTSGAKTRRLIAYLNEAEVAAQEQGLRSTDFEEKNFAVQLTEAFRASKGMLQSAWQKLHDRELPN